jgi:hypothetical protein
VIALSIRGIAVLGPGLSGWVASRAILAGAVPWEATPFAPPPPALLAATERRRTSPAVRLALALATEAAEACGLPPESLDTVFASSNGDGQVIGAILAALHESEVAISPTQFHNSVHNAAAGYWGIATGSQRASTSVGGYDWVFASGLLQAAIQVASTGQPVLFCASDTPLDPPLSAERPTGCAFGLAFVLAPGGALPGLRISYQATPCDEAPPRLDNPCARGLPLLTALAGERPATLRFAMLEDAHLEVEVRP